MMDLRRQPTARATDAMPGRLTLLIGQILVIRRSPCVLVRARRVRCMLVATIDGAIHGDVPVDITGSISIRKYVGQHPVPGAIGGVAAVTFPYCLPRPEMLARQVTPGDASAVAVDDSFDDSPVVLKRSGSFADV